MNDARMSSRGSITDLGGIWSVAPIVAVGTLEVVSKILFMATPIRADSTFLYQWRTIHDGSKYPTTLPSTPQSSSISAPLPKSPIASSMTPVVITTGNRRMRFSWA